MGTKDTETKNGSPAEKWELRLYVAGNSPRSLTAIRNLSRICEQHMPGRYKIEVIDLLKTPRLAKEHEVIAIPTLIRQLPAPIRKIVGDLSDTHKTLVGLQVVSLSERQSA